ncbi:MAG: DUF6377 domain-containing protein [Prevotellaceae bacterium]|nr:DUF6377 domain-containing protein [Prevotellaceae bacterium]
MKKIVGIILFSLVSSTAMADNARLYSQLDSVVAQRAYYTHAKERHIAEMKKTISAARSAGERLSIYDDIYDEYRYFRFDSAMVTVKRGLRLAEKAHNRYYIQLNTIHQAALLAAAGLYYEGYAILDKLGKEKIDPELDYEYNLTFYWLYTYWADYTSNSDYHNIYWAKKLEYLQRTLALAKSRPYDYNYLMGEYELYIKRNYRMAISYYDKVMAAHVAEPRLFSTACFAMAGCYRKLGEPEKYEYYLLQTAITDVRTPIKENLSLYKLALLLFTTNGDIQRAVTYTSVSIEDAKFFNNRLRIINNTGKSPEIATKFIEQVKGQKQNLLLTLSVCFFLLGALIIAIGFIVRQYGLLSKRKKEIAHQNEQLVNLNAELQEVNDELTERNDKLIDINNRRENLAKLYIDLCSKYIDRLNSYQKFVQRKIKVNQINDLLSTITSTRLSDEDAATFLNGFDKAFLDLYPTFIEEFNKLLVPGNEFQLKSGNMTTELRIFALIRLGVQESSEIANLLFCTPRTVYNYRSAMKARAKNKDTFEDDVRALCI